MTRPYVTIVTGLPRSGTSMMMRMLKEGGLGILTDHVRQADEDNPRGYFEFEEVKRTKQDSSWIDRAVGQAVKMVYLLLYDLPPDRQYRVILMRREIREVLASQRTMLERRNQSDAVADESMAALFARQLDKFRQWIAVQEHCQVIEVDYNRIVADPVPWIKKLNAFLGADLDERAMAQVVEPKLYRQRTTALSA